MTAHDELTCPAESGVFCSRKHWSVYWLIIVVAISLSAGRVLTVRNANTRGDSPFFSANDRSRWCTVHSLVDLGTFEIDEVIGRKADIHWDTIDKVQHIGSDGQLHFYSSKPPFLSVLVAGQYWVLQKVTGWRIDRETLPVVRTLLLITNVFPFGLMLWLMAAWLERQFVADWTRYFLLASAAFGTFLSTFLVTLNNHNPAAVAVMMGLFGLSRVFDRRDAGSPSRWADFALIGLATGLATAFELPALAFAGCAAILCLTRSIPKTILGMGLPFMLMAAIYLSIGYWAHGRWEVAYSHRTDGRVAATIQGDFAQEFNAGQIPEELVSAIRQSELAETWAAMKLPKLEVGTWMGQSHQIQNRWVIRDQIGPNQLAIVQSNNQAFEIKHWNNWYDYPGSYWSSQNLRRSEVDHGEASQLSYLFHMLFGHHGVFSLTPLWVFAAAGLMGLTISRIYNFRWLGWSGIVLSVVVLAFYLTRPEHDRNFGGMTSGLRWTFWLIPLWLCAMLPVVQGLARTNWGRALCLAVLASSILSIGYSANNPWVHPWLYELWDCAGWPK